MAWIYMIRNKVNDKKYIGYTSFTPEERFKQHVSQSSSCPLMRSAIAKYGPESFEITSLYFGFDDNHTLFVMEEQFIREYNSHWVDGHGYNMSYGGTSNNRGKKFSDQARANISAAQKGVVRNSGSAISTALTGREITPEWRSKISTSLKGRKLSNDTRDKMRGPRGEQKNKSSHPCCCIHCKKELDVRGINNHNKRFHQTSI